MSDSQGNGYSDEDKYANDSFETEIPESSVYGSEDETSETEKEKSPSKELKSFGRNNDFWTCESSSDEDDVVLGQTVAEINTDPGDFDDDDISLTPAARVFQMASANRLSSGMKNISNREVLAGYEDFDDDLEEIDDETLETESDADHVYKKYAQITTGSEIIYDERIMFETSGIDVDEVYTDVGHSDGGEVDIGEPNFCHELNENEKDIVQDSFEEESDYENKNVEASPNASDYDDDERTLGAASIVTNSTQDDARSETKSETKSELKSETKSESKSESKSLRTDDSMEDFKRKVMLSQRMRCISDSIGERVRSKMRKSGIPVWIGNERSERFHFRDIPKETRSALGVRSMIPIPDIRTHGSLPDFSDAETVTSKRKNSSQNDDCAFRFDELGGESERHSNMSEDFYTEYTASCTADAAEADSCTFSMQMEMFMDVNDMPKKAKKLKAGERRNKSFSNERLRDIERHNHILLHKILNQKPTYVIDERKKKKDKFATLPPSTRVTSAEINRKKQQRQIDLDNQLLKRKLEAIAKRKPKNKQK